MGLKITTLEGKLLGLEISFPPHPVLLVAYVAVATSLLWF